MRRIGLAAAAALVALGLGLAAAPDAEGRTVRWSASGDPNTMDPHSQNVGTVTKVLQRIDDPLIARNADLSLRPGLALSWTQVEPNGWRFVLRQGVRFREGEAFTDDRQLRSVN